MPRRRSGSSGSSSSSSSSTGQLRRLAGHLLPAAATSPSHPLHAKRGAHERSKDPKVGVDISGPGTDSRRKGYGLTTRDNAPLPAVNSFGVSTVLPGYGVLPKKVRTWEAARVRVGF
jgi:hypothetical protein